MRRCMGRLINRTVKIDFEDDEGRAAGMGQWRGFDLYEWMRTHEVLRETKTKWQFKGRSFGRSSRTRPRAAFLLGRAVACDFNLGSRWICVEVPFPNNASVVDRPPARASRRERRWSRCT